MAPSTADLDDDVNLLRGQINLLQNEVAALTGKMEMLFIAAKYLGTGLLVVIIIQTIGIVALAGKVMDLDASAKGITVGAGS